MIKHYINLLQTELKPERQLLTLKNIVMLWALVFIMMMIFAGYGYWKNSKLQWRASELKAQNTQLKSQMNDLNERLDKHKANAELIAELDTINSLISNKSNLHSYLTNTKTSYVAGFALAMEELSTFHSKDISLQHITLRENQVSFAGFARNANAVPSWLANFEDSEVLSGKTFQHMKMAEQENGKLIEFSVSSNASFNKELP